MIDFVNKLTEDETVELLMKFLKSDGYKILDFCKGHKRGIDITAEKSNRKLLVEVSFLTGVFSFFESLKGPYLPQLKSANEQSY